MTENKTKSLAVGSDILNLLSDSLYPEKSMIFDEIIINSLDAGASNIDIIYNTDTKGNITQIIFEDNGPGISKTEMFSTISIANSSKKNDEEKVKIIGTNDSRYIRGKFGLGKISTNGICNKLMIESWDTNKYGFRFHIDFSEIKNKHGGDISKYNVPVDENLSFSDEGHSGTRVILYDVFDLKESDLIINSKKKYCIKNKLRQSLPFDNFMKIRLFNSNNRSDLDINEDKYLIKEFNYKNESKLLNLDEDINKHYIHFSVEVKKNLTANCKLFIFNKNCELNMDGYGSFITVKDRIVNSNDTLNVIELNTMSHDTFFHRRIKLFIEANFLENSILANRSAFKKSAIFDLFKEKVEEKLKKIATEAYKIRKTRYVESKFKVNGLYITKENYLENKKKELDLAKKIAKEERERLENINLEKKQKQFEILRLFTNKIDYSFDKNFFISNDNFEQDIELFVNKNKSKLIDKNLVEELNEKLSFLDLNYYLGENKNNLIVDKNTPVKNWKTHYINFHYKEEDRDEIYLNYNCFPRHLKGADYYYDLIDEINKCIIHRRFTGALILCRKLFENYLNDFIKTFFLSDFKKFEKLSEKVKTLNRINTEYKITEETEFKILYDKITKFRKESNSNTHNLVIICKNKNEFELKDFRDIYNRMFQMWELEENKS